MLQRSLYFSQINSTLNRAVLAPMIENRTTGVAIMGAAILHGLLMFLGLPSWQCPIRDGLGLPCPGCGLSRATAALFHGDWRTSLNYHAFAPLFLVAFLVIAGATFLPSSPRHRLIEWISWIECRTGITAILLIIFVLYWLARLVVLRGAFINLIMG